MNGNGLREETDIKELSNFFKKAWPLEPHNTSEESIKWRYRKQDTYSGINLVYRKQNKIIGHLGILPVKVKTEPDIIDAAWLLDWYVLPSHRGGTAGMRIMNEAISRYKLCMAVGLTEISESIFRRSGWFDCGIIQRYCLVLNPGPIIKTKLPFLKYFSPIIEITKKMNNFYLRNADKNKKEYILKEENPNFKLLSEFILNNSQKGKIYINRTEEYLRSRYGYNSPWEYKFINVYDDNSYVGWAVWSLRKRMDGIVQGNIIEIFSKDNSEEIKIDILKHIISKMKLNGVDLVDIIGRNLFIEKNMIDSHFKRRQGLRFMWKSNEEYKELKNTDNWYITRGDSDQDR